MHISPGIYVVFTHSDDILLKFLKNGFKHCDLLVVTKDRYKHKYLSISFDSFGINIEEVSRKIAKIMLSTNQYRFVKKSSKFELKSCVHLLTCVSFVKMYLKIKSFFVFTPYQLYKKLGGNYE